MLNPALRRLLRKPSLAVFTFDTTKAGSANNQIVLPLEASGLYNFTVYWGDGTCDRILSYNQAQTTHTYGATGTYDVSFKGLLRGWRFNNGGDKLKITNIKQWGKDFSLGNSGGYFYGCANLTISAVDAPNLKYTNSLYYAFYGCTSLTTNAGMAVWDLSGVVTLASAFRGCTSFNADITKWDVSKVLSLQNTFYQCTAFNQNLSAWNIVSLDNLEYTFVACPAFNQNLSAWNTANVTLMTMAFYGATSFNQNLAAWNIEKVTSMSSMFHNVTLSTANYDAMLIGWSAQNVHNNVAFDGGGSKYTTGGAAEAGRTHLVSTHTWTIVDGGGA
jgi:surface protein